MKNQSLLLLLISGLFFTVLSAHEFCLITNETLHAIDVFELTKLDKYCFAGAEPFIGSQIYLQYDQKPRVLSKCFPESVYPIVPSIRPHENRQVPAYERIILKCTMPFYFKQCLHCRNFWGFGQGNEMFAYQLIETKPGWHYKVYDDSTSRIDQQKSAP